MQPYWHQPLRDSTLNWAEWTLLDALLKRYFPAVEQLLHGPAGANGAAVECRDTVASGVDPAAFSSACRELADPASPVMSALTALWAQRGTTPAAAAAVNAKLEQLSAEQALVLLTVVAQAYLGA